MLPLMGHQPGELDLAIIGAGVAGAAVAYQMQRAKPGWSITLFERTGRIGGRLHSVRIDGLDHPIELGGMRYITSQSRMTALIDEFELPTHPFDASGGPGRSVLRGVVGGGFDDPNAGRGYDLAPAERGRSAADLARFAFKRIVPGFDKLDHAGYARRRATGHYLDRRITDWSIGDARATVLSPDAAQFVVDAFGFDSGGNAFNASDHIEFLNSGGDPSAEARTPDGGMDVIPRELAARFVSSGGAVDLDHELASITIEGRSGILRFANGRSVRSRRTVLALPQPALRLLASTSPVLTSTSFARVFDSVGGYPAMKLYLWFEHPWWRPSVPGIRTSTDLPLRNVFYFDGSAGHRSALLAIYADWRTLQPWVELFEGGQPGAPAPAAMVAAVQGHLRAAHPEVSDIPSPLGSALMYWGADPREVAWHMWRAGVVSDEILDVAAQPETALPIYLANEAFSRLQTWAEGALEAADLAVERLRRVEP